MKQAFQLILRIDTESRGEAEELESITRQLRKELLELDVEAIDFANTGEMPTKAKAGAPIDWSTLILTLAASGGVITTIIGVAQSWLARHEKRSIALEIDGDRLEITGISSEEQQNLTNAWLSRHRGVLISHD